MPRLIVRVFLFLFPALFISCSDHPLQVRDAEKKEIPYRSYRFDRDFFNTDFSDVQQGCQALYQNYGTFFCLYMEDIVRIGPCLPDSDYSEVANFISDRFVKEEYDAIQQLFTDEAMAPVDKEIEQALRYWHYYFPEKPIPHVIYMHSAFNLAVGSTDSLIAIGLENFLGPNHPIVEQLPGEYFPGYLKKDMDAQYMASDAIKDFVYHQARSLMNENHEPANLLGHLVHNGKCFYMLDALMPLTPDPLKMNWTASEWQWAVDNERNTWKELARQEVMFQTKPMELRKWLENGPFTNAGAMPQDSPPQIGIWMGWQMVRSYMRSHKETTLSDLFSKVSDEEILKAYRPSK